MKKIETPDGFIVCNLDHYLNVRRAREKAGLFVKHDVPQRDYSHPLVGRKVHSGKTYTVDYVVKNWHWGHYLTLFLVTEGGSHRLVCWENLGTCYPTVKEAIENNRKEFASLLCSQE
jgi:hypothetical protein